MTDTSFDLVVNLEDASSEGGGDPAVGRAVEGPS